MLGIPYLSKYPDQFYSVSIRAVSRPLLKSKFLGSINEVESHNKSHPSDIALDKFWVAQYGWLWLCNTGSMGMTMNNEYKRFAMVLRGATMTSLLSSGNYLKNRCLLIKYYFRNRHRDAVK